MPGPILHVGATVLCSHGGQATPTAPNPRVTVSGMPVATIAAPYAVAGCAFVPPAGNGPCVTGQWIVGATRVLALGQPVVIMTGVLDVRAHGHAAPARVGPDPRDRDVGRCTSTIPYHFDGRGRTATTTDDDHVRDMIEQVLFTIPGERVNRPDFGSGLLQLTFAPLSDELASATQFLVQGSLQQWLGDIIAVEQVSRDTR